MEQEAKQYITKDMTIGEVIEKFPDTAEVMLSYGLHCVGCHVNPLESIEAGAMGHGMSDEEVTSLINDMNKKVEEVGGPKEEEPAGDVSEHTITLTESAAEKIKELAVKHEKVGYGYMVKVLPGGCSGLQYAFDFKEKPDPDDVVFEQHGLKVFVDKKSLEQIDGLEIDYVDSLQGGGFKTKNPQAQGTCGCGKSFK